jgi:hypothetical protein
MQEETSSRGGEQAMNKQAHIKTDKQDKKLTLDVTRVRVTTAVRAGHHIGDNIGGTGY